MRIAQVAPLTERVPPKFYGGTERVVSYLTEELVRMGHEVTLFASADSVTRAELRPMCPRSLRLDRDCLDPIAHFILMAEIVARAAPQLGIIHAHTDYFLYSLARRISCPVVHTTHGRLDFADIQALMHEFADRPLVSITNNQRKPLPHSNWVATVNHGLPIGLFSLKRKPSGYLAF